jgi:hypothetical protein
LKCVKQKQKQTNKQTNKRLNGNIDYDGNKTKKKPTEMYKTKTNTQTKHLNVKNKQQTFEQTKGQILV